MILCIWWDMKGVVYYELLKPGENGNRYRHELMKLKQTIHQKRPEWEERHANLILHHDNARSHVAQPVQTYHEGLNWEVLAHSPYSPDIAPSDFYLFRFMMLSSTYLHLLTTSKRLDFFWEKSKDQGLFSKGIQSLPER